MFVRNGQKLGSLLVDKASSEPELEQQDTAEGDSGEATEVKPSKSLTKDELVDLAEAAGLGERDDLAHFTKQELIDELNASEGEG